MKRIYTKDSVTIQLEGCCRSLRYFLFRIVLDGSEPEDIRQIAKDNEWIIRRFMVMAWSFENTFKFGFSPVVPVWEQHNRMNINEYYHDQMDEMEAENEANFRQYQNYLRDKFLGGANK